MSADNDVLLWPFSCLDNETYVVLDTETTGLFDEDGAPDLISLGIVLVDQGAIVDSEEYKVRPNREISLEAQRIHGISNEEASQYPLPTEQWPKISAWLEGQLVVIHNAGFDWRIICAFAEKHQFTPPQIRGVFCSQKAATAWAESERIPCSARGPSLDNLTRTLGCEDLRALSSSRHGALIDARQTAEVVLKLTKRASCAR